MNRIERLAGMGVIAAPLEVKLHPQGVIRHEFEPAQDRCLRHVPARNQVIAMIALCDAENPVRGHGLPKRDVVQGIEPVLDILDVLKNNHNPLCHIADSKRKPPDERAEHG